MSIQNVTEVSVRLGEEVTWGVIPPNPQLTELQKVSWSVNLTTDTYTSNRLRADRQIAEVGFGPSKTEGDFSDELSLGDHDRLLAGLLCGNWTPGVVSNDSFSVDGAANTYVRAGGSFIADGILPGDSLMVSGFVHAENNGAKVAVAVTATTVTVTDDLTTEAAVAAHLAVDGQVLKNGKVKHSYFAEVFKPDVDGPAYERQTGLRINTGAISLPPTGIPTIRYGLMGRDMQVSNAPLDGSVDDAPGGRILSASNGRCFLGGQEVSLLTQLDINLTNNVQGSPVVGSKFMPALLYGKSAVTGTFSAMVSDSSLAATYREHATTSLTLVLDAEDGSGFLSISLPRIYLTKYTTSVSGEGALMVQGEFQATLSKPHGAAILIQKGA